MRLFFYSIIGILLFPASSVYAFDAEVHFLFRSFIKAEHPTRSSFTTMTDKGTHVIKVPEGIGLELVYCELIGTCFATDNRNFSNEADASARTTVEFILRISGREMTLTAPPNRPMKRTGITHSVDCETGQELRVPRQASADKFRIGPVKSGGVYRTLFVKAAASNPFFDKLARPAPDIDFSFTIRYNIIKREFEVNGSTDNFPAFEGYYAINGGNWQTLLKWDPAKGATALSLIDLNLGINQRNFSHQFHVR